MDCKTIEVLLAQGFPDAKIQVRGDGHHFEALVVSERFAGKNPVSRHQLVYQALGDRMREDIHALSIKAMTPAERAGSGT